MNATRSLELCQQPLDASRSHHVSVDRNALTFLRDERNRLVKELASSQKDVENLNAEVKNSQERMLKFQRETLDLVKVTRDNSDPGLGYCMAVRAFIEKHHLDSLPPAD